MPTLSKQIPSYRKHRASGQAVVSLNGRDFYLGPHGTRASKLEFDRLVGEWLQQGRQIQPGAAGGELSVVELIAAYLHYVRGYYRKPDGEPTNEVRDIVLSLRPLKALYGRQPCVGFGPTALKVVRQKMVDDGMARKTINQRIGRVKRMFKWGASSELISATIPQALSMVEGLKCGRTDARETKPIQPVDDSIVDATVPFMPEVVGSMVKLQRLTGCRPAELTIMRPVDLDRSGEVWTYRPATHKTEHHGKERIIFIGPMAQEILLRYLARDPQAFCFRPADSEAKRLAARHAARTTPISCGNKPGTNRKSKPKRVAGDRYSVNAYRRAIYRACDLAFPHAKISALKASELTAKQTAELREWQDEHRWAPNRLRHTAGTTIRREFGLEAAQIALGHSQANVTQIYAERDLLKGIEVARMIG
jgi:integrase